MTEELAYLQLLNSYNDANEHKELDIWPDHADGTCRFWSVKTFLDSNTS